MVASNITNSLTFNPFRRLQASLEPFLKTV
jgi:hypothetical protein